MQSKHPDLYFKTSQYDHRDPKLASDESLRAVAMFTIQSKGQDVCHSVFTVKTKSDKAISNRTIIHIQGEDNCPGHMSEIAQYPIADIDDLRSETVELAIDYGVRLATEKSGDLSIDVSKPLFVMMIPPNKTNKEIAEKIEENCSKDMNDPSEIIIKTLGLDPNFQKIPRVIQSSTEKSTIISSNQNKEVKSPLTKAAEESLLISMYGKAKIEKLAKKIGYKGELINKADNLI